MNGYPLPILVFCTITLVRCSIVQNAVEVNTPSGWVRGYEETHDKGQLYRFIKIPFAQPPVGELRFQKTKALENWEDVKGTREINGPQCPQPQFPIPCFDMLEIDEDCLYLNIYVPGKVSKDRNLSVMVWLYGGGFFVGGASQYKPQKIVLEGDVIVVTTNYRLGLLGFFNMHDPLAPGNYGLWDQIEALRWIQKNIASFGGNPKSVTLFGQSAGGASAVLLAMVPSNEGLFQRVISQSGPVSFFTIGKRRAIDKTNAMFLDKTNCKKENIDDTLKCLRELPVDNITEAINMAEFTQPLNVTFEIGGMGPSIDGELITENFAYPKPWDNEIYRFFRSVDFLSGTVDGEGGSAYSMITPELSDKMHINVSESVPKSVLCELFAPVFVETVAGNKPSITQAICNLYTVEDKDEQSNKVFEFLGDAFGIAPNNILISTHAKENERGRTFQYLITKRTPYPLVMMDPPSWLKGAAHGDELHLFFNMSHDYVPEETLKSVDVESVNKLSKDIIQYWTNFAKTGDPNSEELPVWPKYESSREQYVIIDTPITSGEHLHIEATELMKTILTQDNLASVHDEL